MMKLALTFLIALAASRCENCQPPPPCPDAGAPTDDAGMLPDDAGMLPDGGQDAGQPPPPPVWCYQPPHASGPTDDQCFPTQQACEAGRAYWQGRASECWESSSPNSA